jgi:isopenicillin N synthase-like dioxygenase
LRVLGKHFKQASFTSQFQRKRVYSAAPFNVICEDPVNIDIIPYASLLAPTAHDTAALLTQALREKGIVGVKGVPHFEEKSADYIKAMRTFAALPEAVKQSYAPARERGETEGYELGAEWFKNSRGEWQIDDRKASYYAWVPDHPKNRWPQEVNLRDAYLTLASIIFEAGKQVLNATGLLEAIQVDANNVTGHGRMLHYQKIGDASLENPDWCGAHLDHGVLTALMPAYYFRDGIAISEPEEAGLFIMPTGSDTFEKAHAADKSILLFQIGEFGQLASQDRMSATRHIVKKARGNIERFTCALFLDAPDTCTIQSHSILTQDARYQENCETDGRIQYGKWATASYARYLAKQNAG